MVYLKYCIKNSFSFESSFQKRSPFKKIPLAWKFYFFKTFLQKTALINNFKYTFTLAQIWHQKYKYMHAKPLLSILLSKFQLIWPSVTPLGSIFMQHFYSPFCCNFHNFYDIMSAKIHQRKLYLIFFHAGKTYTKHLYAALIFNILLWLHPCFYWCHHK